MGAALGPIAFVAAWASLGATTSGYDPVRQPISRLAALGAPTRPAMTAALLALGAGMAAFGLAVRPAPAWPLPVVNGATAVAVAAVPLGGRYDTVHGWVAVAGYVTLAAIPLVVGGRSRATLAATVVSAACLVASALGPWDGLFQRAGLTVAHLWVAVTSLRAAVPTSPSTTPPARGPAARRR